MGQVLYGSAKTTHIVRALIQRSQASNAALSGRLASTSKPLLNGASKTALLFLCATANAPASDAVVAAPPWDQSPAREGSSE